MRQPLSTSKSIIIVVIILIMSTITIATIATTNYCSVPSRSPSRKRRYSYCFVCVSVERVEGRRNHEQCV